MNKIDLSPTDTIVAIATPPGKGGIGIVRVSGPGVPEIARQVVGRLPTPRTASTSRFKDAQHRTIDEGLALYFRAPASFTGEEVLELHGHGGPIPMDMLVSRCLSLGARLAEAGEFSQRAFLNGKIDLTQAEAISDLIDSSSRQAARAALRSLDGEFARRINVLLKALTELRMYVEAAIDFPEEEIDFLADNELKRRLLNVEEQHKAIAAAAQQGQLLRDGMVLVITGRPNVGKSSLLNQLAGKDTAIVTALAGTTRDLLREDIHIDGMPLHIVDTAGLHDSDDEIEIEGMRRAREALAKADHILLLRDASNLTDDDANLEGLPAGVPVTHIINKIDLQAEVSVSEGYNDVPTLRISALKGEGIEGLRQYLKEQMGFAASDSSQLIARRRHLDALARTGEHLHTGKRALLDDKAGEIMAEELRLAQQVLGEITGRFSSDDLLGEIFSSFCIGK